MDDSNENLEKRKSIWGPQQSLKRKRILMVRRTRACDFSLALALFGIIVTVVQVELSEAEHIEKDSLLSVIIQCVTIASTFGLLYEIAYYHFIELKIAAIDSGTDDWRIRLTWTRILQCSLELCVCAVCPFPGGVHVNWIVLPDPCRSMKAPVRLDIVLSIPMFLRFYLLCRFIVLHSRQFKDAATRSIASLNYIAMNFQFVLRTLIDENPLMVMVAFSVCFCLFMAWIVTNCDRYSQAPSNGYFWNALWFTVVTYISIGYGDVVPMSYCARVLAIFTGIVGKVVSSVLIAVMSRKMELSRGEIHVHNFVTDSKLAKRRKQVACRVLQQSWLFHKIKREVGHDEDRLRRHQRQFLDSITEFRRIKWEQRRISERSNSIIDLSIAQKEMTKTVWNLRRQQLFLASQMSFLAERIHEVTMTLSNAQRRTTIAGEIDQRLQWKLASIENGKDES